MQTMVSDDLHDWYHDLAVKEELPMAVHMREVEGLPQAVRGHRTGRGRAGPLVEVLSTILQDRAQADGHERQVREAVGLGEARPGGALDAGPGLQDGPGCGVNERAVRVAEAQGEMLAGVIKAILGDLGLSKEQQKLAPAAERKHLTALPA
jgi:hypothetical protein